MKIVAVGAFGAFPLRIAVIFQADADFEVKSAVDSYFWTVFWHFLGQNFGQNFVFFCVCGPSLLSANAGIMTTKFFWEPIAGYQRAFLVPAASELPWPQLWPCHNAKKSICKTVFFLTTWWSFYLPSHFADPSRHPSTPPLWPHLVISTHMLEPLGPTRWTLFHIFVLYFLKCFAHEQNRRESSDTFDRCICVLI